MSYTVEKFTDEILLIAKDEGIPPTQRLEKILRERFFFKEKIKRNSILLIEWDIEDVIACAEEMDIAFSDEESKEVLKHLNKTHDREFGITWEHVKAAIEYVIKNWEELRG